MDDLMLEETLRAVKAGDKERYADIVRRYQQQLFVYCSHLLMQREEAADAVQDVFLKAYEKLHKYEYAHSFTAWLYKIAYRHCMNLLKKRKRQKLLQLFAERAEAGAAARGSAAPFESGDEKFSEDISAALSRLSPVERAVIVLRFVEERSYEEISAILDNTPAALRKKLERAKAKIRAEWGQTGEVKMDGYEPKRNIQPSVEQAAVRK